MTKLRKIARGYDPSEENIIPASAADLKCFEEKMKEFELFYMCAITRDRKGEVTGLETSFFDSCKVVNGSIIFSLSVDKSYEVHMRDVSKLTDLTVHQLHPMVSTMKLKKNVQMLCFRSEEEIYNPSFPLLDILKPAIGPEAVAPVEEQIRRYKFIKEYLKLTGI